MEPSINWNGFQNFISTADEASELSNGILCGAIVYRQKYYLKQPKAHKCVKEITVLQEERELYESLTGMKQVNEIPIIPCTPKKKNS